MEFPEFVKPKRIWLKDHPKLDERWLQNRIAEDPAIIGLGDLILKDRERMQPKAGRLDILLQDADSNHRFEVEIQLGSTDERHIIRTIEYWDVERKRYPQYDHTAVIVAEDMTSRFLNVISLFNGVIPLVAVQLHAVELDDKVSLIFTKVLDQMTLGLVEEDEETYETVDRGYWEQRGTKETVEITDKLLSLIHSFAPDMELKYNKFYIGLARSGRPENFAIFRPQKSAVRVDLRLPRSDEVKNELEQAGLDLLDYSTRSGRYRVRLSKRDLGTHGELLSQYLQRAYEEHTGG